MSDLTESIVGISKQGVTLFCLQEVVARESDFIIDKLLGLLGKDWKAAYHLGDDKTEKSFGTAILWNSDFFHLLEVDKFVLPKYAKIAIHERLFNYITGFRGEIPPRRVLTCIFTVNNQKILVTSTHMDMFGGSRNRLNQLSYLKQHMGRWQGVKYQIIAGDFNSFDLFKTRYEQRKMKQVLGVDFYDAIDKVGWTADLNRIDIPKVFPYFVKTVKLLHIHLKRKLDYVWVSNLGVVSCKKIMAKGSDHFPVVAELCLEK